MRTDTDLAALLAEARPHLGRAFGVSRTGLRYQRTDDGVHWKLVMLLPRDFSGDPEACLRQFDETWWLNNCHRSGGRLVFDYEVAA